jgi:hypothetical protein
VLQLGDDRFACFVVGDVRDRKGFCRNLPGHTIEAFEAARLRLYNEAILVTAAGSRPIRAGKQFAATRKLATIIDVGSEGKIRVVRQGSNQFTYMADAGQCSCNWSSPLCCRSLYAQTPSSGLSELRYAKYADVADAKAESAAGHLPKGKHPDLCFQPSCRFVRQHRGDG